MTVAFGAIGTGASGTTSVAPQYPTGITAGQLLLLMVASGATNSETPGTPAGWISLGSNANTTGTFGLDTGPRRSTVFARVADGSESGTVSVSLTNGNVARAYIMRFTSSIGKSWAIQAGNGNDSSAGTGVSIACGSINWATGDVAVVCVGQLVDSSTQSSQSLTASGTTFGTRTNQASFADTTGNDLRAVIDTFAAVTTGGGSATTTWAYTASSSSTQAAAVIVRIRETGDVAESLSLTAGQALGTVTLGKAVSETLTLTAAQDPVVTLGPVTVANYSLIGLPIHRSTILQRAGFSEASNQTYNKASDESLTLTAAQTEASTLPRAQAEALTLTAAQVGSINSIFSKAQPESLTLTAAQTEIATFVKAQAEAVAFVDTPAIVVTKSINETLIGTPIHRTARWIAAISIGQQNQAESLTFTDSQSESAVFNDAVAESFSLTAAQVNKGFNSREDESFSLTAAQSEISNLIRNQAEALTLTDSQTSSTGLIKTQAEALTLTDAQSGQHVLTRSHSETIAFSDSQNSTFGQAPPRYNAVLVGERRESVFQPWAMDAILGATRNETIAFNDTQAALKALASSRAESLTLTAAQTGVLTKSSSIAESVGFSDQQSASKNAGNLFVKQVEEFLTLVAAQAKIGNVNVQVSESVGLVAAQTESTNKPVQRDESLSFTDAQASSLQPIYAKQTNEQLAFNDNEVASLNHPVIIRQVQDVISFTSEETQVPTLNASKSEFIAFNDIVATATEFSRFMQEVIGFGQSSMIVTGPFSDLYRYDVPGEALALKYDVPGGTNALRYDVPPDLMDVGVS